MSQLPGPGDYNTAIDRDVTGGRFSSANPPTVWEAVEARGPAPLSFLSRYLYLSIYPSIGLFLSLPPSVFISL